MAQYEIGRFVFTSKKEAITKIRQINSISTIDKLLTGDDLDLSVALLYIHPDASTKLARGFTGMCIRQNSIHGGALSRGPHVVPNDCQRTADGMSVVRNGKTIGWSLNVALGLTKSGPQIEKAARNAVVTDIIAYRNKRYDEGDVKCDVTGKLLLRADAQVDHGNLWSFSNILSEFVRRTRALDIEEVTDISDNGICSFEVRFVDPAATAKFRKFHNKFAQLRLVHKDINLSLKQTDTSWIWRACYKTCSRECVERCIGSGTRDFFGWRPGWAS